jgi:hypothetical protein
VVGYPVQLFYENMILLFAGVCIHRCTPLVLVGTTAKWQGYNHPPRLLSQQPDPVAASANSAHGSRGIGSTANSADRARGIRSTSDPADRAGGIRSTTNPADRSGGISSANPADRARGIRSSSTCHDITSSQNMVSDG